MRSRSVEVRGDRRNPRTSLSMFARLEKIPFEALLAAPSFRRMGVVYLVILAAYLGIVLALEGPFQVRRHERIASSPTVYRAYWDGRYHTDAHYEIRAKVLPTSLYEACEDGLTQCTECGPVAPTPTLAPPPFLFHHYVGTTVLFTLVFWLGFLHRFDRRKKKE